MAAGARRARRGLDRVGNVGALGQDSLKRLLGYSGVAQAGYILGGLVVASEAGINALVFYLAGYAFMNLAAFAVSSPASARPPSATTSAPCAGSGASGRCSPGR